MKLRIFLDTNVFIYAFEYSGSNSRKIIDLLDSGKIRAVISERVLIEVMKYFKKYYSTKLSNLFRKYLLNTCIVILKKDVEDKMRCLRGLIKEKEQLAVVKKLKLKYLVAYDRDFEDFNEYITPKEFLKIMELPFNESEF